MNEIKVGVPYSRFKDIFTCYFFARINSENQESVKLAIRDAINYWSSFDSELRNEIIRISEFSIEKNSRRLEKFILWAKHYFDTPQETNTQRPLVDMLPVVNMAKVNHKSGD
jgi:hypothetical protein